MATSTAVIKSTSAVGKTLHKSVTFVNPAAENDKLAVMGSKLNALTTNTYIETNRVNKSNCDYESDGPQKLIPKFTCTEPDFVIHHNGEMQVDYPEITCTSDGKLFVQAFGCQADPTTFKDEDLDIDRPGSQLAIVYEYRDGRSVGSTGYISEAIPDFLYKRDMKNTVRRIIVYSAETKTYAAGKATFTFFGEKE